MGKKYVFVDWMEVEAGYGLLAPGYTPADASPYGVRIRTHKPKVDNEPAIIADKEWENLCVNVYNSVIKADGKYYLYYECYESENSEYKENWFENAKAYLARAESTDGVHWEKKSLNVCMRKGSKDNNIVMRLRPNEHGTSVFYDTNAPEDERFKCITSNYNGKSIKSGERQVWQKGFVSKDGVIWKEIGDLVLGGDTQGSVTYDTSKNKYVIYTKWSDIQYLPRRTIIRYESDTFDGFSFDTKGEIMLYSVPTGDPAMDYYTTAYSQWPGTDFAHIMLPAVYHRTSDEMEINLCTSRDGKQWYLNGNGNEPLIAGGEWRAVYMGCGRIENNDGTWSHYCGGSDYRTHNLKDFKMYSGMIKRATFREDGYVSIRSDSYGGFVTIPIDLRDNKLKINAECENMGYVRVEIVDENSGKAIEGFSKDECVVEKINNVWSCVKWAKDISELDLNERYRLKFYMFKADLFAYEI